MGSVGILGKGMIHLLGEMERYTVTVHYAIKNSMKFKTCELFTSGIFNLCFGVAVDEK